MNSTNKWLTPLFQVSTLFECQQTELLMHAAKSDWIQIENNTNKAALVNESLHM